MQNGLLGNGFRARLYQTNPYGNKSLGNPCICTAVLVYWRVYKVQFPYKHKSESIITHRKGWKSDTHEKKQQIRTTHNHGTKETQRRPIYISYPLSFLEPSYRKPRSAEFETYEARNFSIGRSHLRGSVGRFPGRYANILIPVVLLTWSTSPK